MSGPAPLPDESLQGSRRSRLLPGIGGGRQSLAISFASTLVFLVVVGALLVGSPNWPQVRDSFFNADVFRETFPAIVGGFGINIQLFLVAEVLILPLAMLVAVMRSLPGPVFTPIRGLAIVYADVFRGLPGILVIYVLGFGLPGLGIPGMPKSEFFWGVVTLTLVYSAYVSEVYRAGIDSIHPSQDAAARSLGLSRVQSLRYVVLPQAVRRVIPPLLNDFIGLQKDTALVGLLGLVESFRRASIESSAAFNFTPYLVTALLFLALTLPMARLVDWLVARSRRNQLAGVR
ncbi:MAG: polar amino acid transport system permease protein [Chloroflexota bacterium]|nr:polar amino acid transport system permease protein [Chloroflexota bacterium]